MANKVLDMVRIKQIIMLYESGKSYRDISKQLGLSRKTITKYILLYKSTGLSWDELKQLPDKDFNDRIFNQEISDANRFTVLESMFHITKLAILKYFQIRISLN